MNAKQANRNPADRTKALCPCHGYSEQTAQGSYYGIGWGGGLAEPITTDCYPTKQESDAALERLLNTHGRTIEGLSDSESS